jgi:N-acetylglucosamine-6-phosphate deacetylase
MIVLTGADVVLPEGVRSGATVVLDGDRVVDISTGARAPGTGEIDLRNHLIVPGFIDVHVHGLEGTDALDGGDAVATIARRLPKYGVTAFCPTTVACTPRQLREVLDSVNALRSAVTGASARVLPAHLESNFINPDYRGAQPLECVRTPTGWSGASRPTGSTGSSSSEFDAADIVAVIDRAGPNVGIVTLAPELDGALDLVRHLVASGHRVSLGHSGATREHACAAIDAGARHATHLFNRMPPLSHRHSGLVGAILTREEIAAEVICDGVHVHPDLVHLTMSAKGASRVKAITDGVAAAGLPDGAIASLGGRPIHVRDSAAYLDDGTRAGSVATMDRVFRFLVNDVAVSLTDASRLCATTPASELGLRDLGFLKAGAIADLVVLDRELRVKDTYIAGQLVYSRSA